MSTITETTTAATLLDAGFWTGRVYGATGWADAPYVAETTETATGEVLGTVGVADSGTVAAMGERAALVQPEWAATPFTERAAILRRAADLFERHAEEIAGWIVRESGSILPKADVEIRASVGECLEAAALPSQPHGLLLPSLQPGRTSTARRVPLGVVGVITPWNFPLILAMRSVAPALALGNAVIVKADPNTPVAAASSSPASSRRPACRPACCRSAGGADVGEALVADPNVAWSRSPARPPPGAASARPPAATSSAPRWSSAATTRSSCSTTPTSTPPRRPAPGARSCTRARSAWPPGATSSTSDRRGYLEARPPARRACPSATRTASEVALGPIINGARRADVQRIVDGSTRRRGDRAGGRRP